MPLGQPFTRHDVLLGDQDFQTASEKAPVHPGHAQDYSGILYAPGPGCAVPLTRKHDPVHLDRKHDDPAD